MHGLRIGRWYSTAKNVDKLLISLVIVDQTSVTDYSASILTALLHYVRHPGTFGADKFSGPLHAHYSHDQKSHEHR